MNTQTLIMVKDYMFAEELKNWIECGSSHIEIIGIECNCALGLEKFRRFLPQIIILDASMVLIRLQDFIEMLQDYSSNFHIILLNGSGADSALPHIYQNIPKTDLTAALLIDHMTSIIKLFDVETAALSSSVYNEEYFSKIIDILSNGGFSSKNRELLQKNLHWKLTPVIHFLLLYPIHEIKKISWEMLMHMQEILDSSYGGAVFLSQENVLGLLLNSASPAQEALSFDPYSHILNKLQHLTRSQYHIHFIFFFGNECSLNDLNDTYELLLQYYKQGFFCKEISLLRTRISKPATVSKKFSISEETLVQLFLSLFQDNGVCFEEHFHTMYMKTLKYSFSLEACFHIFCLLELLYQSFCLLYPSFSTKESAGQAQQAFHTVYMTLEDEYQKLYPLFAEMNSFANTTLDKPNKLILQAVLYCIIHCSEAPSLSKVAAVIHITPTYLSHLFKKDISVTFSDFQMDLRITLAKRLMKSTRQKIFEVAERCGFSDYRYFCNTFRKHTGLTPTEYRSCYSLQNSRKPVLSL